MQASDSSTLFTEDRTVPQKTNLQRECNQKKRDIQKSKKEKRMLREIEGDKFKAIPKGQADSTSDRAPPDYKVAFSPPVETQWNTHKKYEKKSKESSTFHTRKVSSDKSWGKKCDEGVSNNTGSWYTEMGKNRENLRRYEKSGDWQFARGRRDIKKIAEEQDQWYFRRMHVKSQS